MSAPTSAALSTRAASATSTARTATCAAGASRATSCRLLTLHSRHACAPTNLIQVLLLSRLQHRHVENRNLLTLLDSAQDFRVIEVADAEPHRSRRVLPVLRNEDQPTTAAALTAAESALTCSSARRAEPARLSAGARASRSRGTARPRPGACTSTTRTALPKRARARNTRVYPDCGVNLLRFRLHRLSVELARLHSRAQCRNLSGHVRMLCDCGGHCLALLIRYFRKIEASTLAAAALLRRCSARQLGAARILAVSAGWRSVHTLRTADALCAARARPQRRAHGVGVEAEHRCNDRDFIGIAHGIVRHGEHILAPLHFNRHFAVHSRHEKTRLIVDADQHGEHCHRLLNRRLRLDLFNGTHERAIRESVDDNLRHETRADFADVGLVNQSSYAHFRQVGHLDDRRSAAQPARSRCDYLSQRNRLLDHGSGNRSADRRLLETLSSQIERRAISQNRRLRVRVLDLRRFTLDRGNDSLLVELLRAIARLPCHPQVDVCRVEVGARLRV